jgi:hypothetical protein
MLAEERRAAGRRKQARYVLAHPEDHKLGTWAMKYTRHAIIPDTQVKPGVPIDHLGWAGQYIAEKRADTIVALGDHYDLPSLSADLDAGDAAFLLLHAPLSRIRGYQPRKVFLVGNHEQRYTRLIDAQPKLRGALRAPWDYPRSLGWEVVPFLEAKIIDGIAYAHYFCRGPSGTVTNSRRGAPSARAMVTREMMSCTAGHKQGLDVFIYPTSHGMMRGIIAGSFYQHEEGYLSPQGTNYWRGILMKNEVHKGSYNLLEVSLDYLRRTYG